MKIKIIGLIIFINALIINFTVCSTAPKKPTEITVLRRNAEKELELGNNAIGQGQYDNALQLLTEAKRKAISVDDSSLIIRTGISRGNLLLAMEKYNEAFTEWDAAIAEAQKFENAELLAVARISRARGSLLTERESARTVLELAVREHSNIKNRYYIAFSWQVRGLALRALSNYTEAENAVKQSYEIHIKDRYLESASYDWYIIASIRSLAGNYPAAIQALETSMEIDRRIENSWGLSSSWKALGDVYSKKGREQDARLAYERADMILKSMY